MTISSGAAALLFGVAWADFVHGVPMNAQHQVTATLWDLLQPYALLGGLTTLSLFLTHGAIFLTLRTRGELTERAAAVARRTAPITALLTVAFLTWTVVDQSADIGVLLPAIAAAGLTVAIPIALSQSAARAFAVSAGAVVLLTVVLLAALYPNALVSSSGHAFDLTLAASSSSHYTLVVMTVVAGIFVPIVLAYQAWTYWVFRHRLGRDDYEGPMTPIAVLEQRQHRAASDPPVGA